MLYSREGPKSALLCRLTSTCEYVLHAFLSRAASTAGAPSAAVAADCQLKRDQWGPWQAHPLAGHSRSCLRPVTRGSPVVVVAALGSLQGSLETASRPGTAEAASAGPAAKALVRLAAGPPAERPTAPELPEVQARSTVPASVSEGPPAALLAQARKPSSGKLAHCEP